MWIPQKNEDLSRQKDSQQKKTSRPQEINDRIRLKFPKAARLLSRFHFHRIVREGSRLSGKTISMQFLLRESAPCSKLGITISKKYGKAHVRNRFKRLVREAFREYYPQIPVGMEIHVLPRLAPEKVTKKAVLEDLGFLVAKIMSRSPPQT